MKSSWLRSFWRTCARHCECCARVTGQLAHHLDRVSVTMGFNERIGVSNSPDVHSTGHRFLPGLCRGVTTIVCPRNPRNSTVGPRTLMANCHRERSAASACRPVSSALLRTGWLIVLVISAAKAADCRRVRVQRLTPGMRAFRTRTSCLSCDGIHLHY